MCIVFQLYYYKAEARGLHASKMGSSSSEEAAELVATIRGEHVVMKKWFNDSDSPSAEALRNKFGSYPGLWKEVLNWAGWKEARKTYLRHTQGASSPAIVKQESKTDEVKDDAAPRKKRSSRWGNADKNDTQDNSANKRRSRWGRDETNTTTSTNAAPTGSSIPGHYGPSGGGGGGAAMQPIPGLGLPGMPTNLTPQQQQEMRTLQGRLRETNQKLDSLEIEAIRVDSLPRGHRERSPSPPPGKYILLKL